MVERFTQGKLVWVCMKNPTSTEVQKVILDLSIPPILMMDLTTPVPKSSAVRAESSIKVTLDFPVVKRIDSGHQFEVKFIISKHSLVTVQYEEMEGIDRFRRQFEVATALRKKQKNITGAHLFISLMNNLYDTAISKLDYIETQLTDIEARIFKNNEKQMVVEISEVSKKLISFRHIIRSHEDVFRDARQIFEALYPTVFSNDFQNIQGQYFLLLRRSNTLFESLTALRETNAAMLNTRQNEIMKTLTIMAFVTFPLTLFSSLFGMNTESTPIIGTPHDFWIIVGVMLFAAGSFTLFFKHKGWI